MMTDTMGREKTPKVGDLVFHKDKVYGLDMYGVIDDVVPWKWTNGTRGVVSEFKCYAYWYKDAVKARVIYEKGRRPNHNTAINETSARGYHYSNTLKYIGACTKQATTTCNCNVWVTGCKCGVFKKEKAKR